MQKNAERTAILSFLLLTFVLPLPILMADRLSIPFPLLVIYASWTPNIAAFLVLGIVLREPGAIRRLLSRWVQWRVGLRWYGAALTPFLVAFGAAGFYLLWGGVYTPPVEPVGGPLALTLIFAVITGALGEELGWRGFLLPRLQRRMGALIATLGVGVVWALWHLPLWMLPGQVWRESIPYGAFALSAVASSFIYTWVVNGSGGSLLLASLAHVAMNFGSGIVSILGLIPPGAFWVWAALLYSLSALAIIMLDRSSFAAAVHQESADYPLQVKSHGKPTPG